MSWTINEQSKTSETQYFIANYSVEIPVENGITVESAKINVAGYSAGTISFTISDPATWVANSTIEISILGSISTINFIAYTLIVKGPPDPPPSVFTLFSSWDIPVEKVALNIRNVDTDTDITVSDIKMIAESNGGGIDYISSSGTIIGAAGTDTDVQYNKGGIFGGDSGLTYDYHAAGDASDPAIFSVGEGKVMGAIRRFCVDDPAKSWEDGNCGNSSSIVFLPRDFLNNAPHGSGRVASYNVDVSSNMQVGQTLADVNTIYATKLIPNGFRIPREPDPVNVYSNAAGGFGGVPPAPAATLTVTVTQLGVLGGTSTAVDILGGLASPTTAVLVFVNAAAPVTPAVNSVISNGNTYVCVGITTTATGLTAAAGLVGVSVPIERQ